MYKQISDTVILRVEDGCYVPVDPANKNYQDYLAWVAEEANILQPPDRAPPPPLPELSDRQFVEGLAYISVITTQEAKAWVSRGQLPTLVNDFLAELTDEWERFRAEMLLCGAKTYQRENSMVDRFGEELGMSSQQVDDFWRFCATL